LYAGAEAKRMQCDVTHNTAARGDVLTVLLVLNVYVWYTLG